MRNSGCGCGCENNPCGGNNSYSRNTNCCDILEQVLASQGNNPNNSANTFKVLVFILLLCANQFVQQQVCFYQNIVCELLSYFICSNKQMMCRNQCMTQSLMNCCANR